MEIKGTKIWILIRCLQTTTNVFTENNQMPPQAY